MSMTWPPRHSSSSSAATSTPNGWRSRVGVPVATRRWPRWHSVTSSRPASADTASATSRCSRGHPQVRIALHGPARRPVSRDGRCLPRTLADPLSRPDLVPGARDAGSRRPGRPAVPGGVAGRGLDRTATSRARISRSPAKVTASAAPRLSAVRSTPEIEFLAQVFGFVPADPLEPLDMPGLDEWRQRRAGGSATPALAARPPQQTRSPPWPRRRQKFRRVRRRHRRPAQTLSTHRSPKRNVSRQPIAPERPKRRRSANPKPDEAAGARGRSKRQKHTRRTAVATERPKRRRTTKPKTSTADEASAAD